MNIEFLTAKRTHISSVEVTYKLEDTEFTVEWSDTHPETGEIGSYDLDVGTKSVDSDLAFRVDNAIRAGQTDDNDDIELYLFIRDTFDNSDCGSCDTPAFEIKSETDFEGLEDFGCGSYLTRLGGCADYGNDHDIGLGGWTYQIEVDVVNQVGERRTFTVAFQLEERTNGMKNYSGYEIAPASHYGYDADESDELERFCDHDTTVLDALYDIAKKDAQERFENLKRLLKSGQIKVKNDE